MTCLVRGSSLASGDAGIWVVGRELFSGVVFDEPSLPQPLDGPALGSDITQGVPRRDQFGVVFIDLALEPSERCLPLQRLAQSSASGAVADAVGKIGHVLVPHVGRKGVYGNEIQLVEFDRVMPVYARVAGPVRYLASARVDQPPVLVVSLIRQRRCDLLNVGLTEVEHLLRVEPEPGVLHDPVTTARPATSSRRNDATSVRASRDVYWRLGAAWRPSATLHIAEFGLSHVGGPRHDTAAIVDRARMSRVYFALEGWERMAQEW